MGVGSSAGRRNGSPRSERGTGGRQGTAVVGCWIRLCVSSSSSSSRAKVDAAAATARAASGNASPILTLSSSAAGVSLPGHVCFSRLKILCLPLAVRESRQLWVWDWELGKCALLCICVSATHKTRMCMIHVLCMCASDLEIRNARARVCVYGCLPPRLAMCMIHVHAICGARALRPLCICTMCSELVWYRWLMF